MLSDWIRALSGMLTVPLFVLTVIETRSSTRSEFRLRGMIVIGIAAAAVGVFWRFLRIIEPYRPTQLLNMFPGFLLLLVLALIIWGIRADKKSVLRLIFVGTLIPAPASSAASRARDRMLPDWPSDELLRAADEHARRPKRK